MLVNNLMFNFYRNLQLNLELGGGWVVDYRVSQVQTLETLDLRLWTWTLA